MMISVSSLVALIGGLFLNVGPSQNMTTICDDTYKDYEYSILLRYYDNAQLGNTTLGGNPVDLAGAQTQLPYLVTNNPSNNVNDETLDWYASTFIIQQYSNVEMDAPYQINLNYNTLGRIGHDINFKLTATSHIEYVDTSINYSNRLQVTRNAQYDGINVELTLSTFLWAELETSNGDDTPYIFFSTLRSYHWDLRHAVNPLDITYTQNNFYSSSSVSGQWDERPSGSIVDGYDSWHTGYLFGIRIISPSPDDTSAYSDGYSDGYDDGYANGLEVGSQSPGITFQQLIGTIIDTPILYLRKFFGYEVFGVNMYYALATLMSLLVALAVFRLVRGIV